MLSAVHGELARGLDAATRHLERLGGEPAMTRAALQGAEEKLVDLTAEAARTSIKLAQAREELTTTRGAPRAAEVELDGTTTEAAQVEEQLERSREEPAGAESEPAEPGQGAAR